MNLVLDFDGTIYGPSVPLKNSVVPLLKRKVIDECALPGEGLEDCRLRLARKHETQSLFMSILFETGCSEETLLEETYIKGMRDCGFVMELRDGVSQLLQENHSVTVLTNAPVSWVKYQAAKLGIDAQIGQIFGLRRNSLFEKPSIEAFTQVTHDPVVFVDDIHKNCTAALQLGWKSFWFPEDPSLENSELKTREIEKISSAQTVYDYLRRS